MMQSRVLHRTVRSRLRRRSWKHIWRGSCALLVTTLVATTLMTATNVSAVTPQIGVTTTPGLYPAFSANVMDYVVRCEPGVPVSVTVTVPSGSKVVLDWGPVNTATFTASESLTPGQRFTITAWSGDEHALAYSVRCLPTDFPNFTSQRLGPTQAAFYVVLPSGPQLFGPSPPTQYLAVFDSWGVPVWWQPEDAGYDGTILPDGTVANITFRDTPQIPERALGGAPVRSFGGALAYTDGHELQQLPNGNDLVIVDYTVHGDLTFMGQSSDSAIEDNVIEELSPSGGLVWGWDAFNHIPLTETDPQWRSSISPSPIAPFGFDNYHMNSVAEFGQYLLVSFRSLDAVYLIDKVTGDIIWKLGGTHTPESLTVLGDQVFSSGGGFGGQHDARFLTMWLGGDVPGGWVTHGDAGPEDALPSGTFDITLHDNGSGRGRPPRAVRYRISISQQTATLKESVSDPLAPTSTATGSARKLPGGDWVVSWGFDPVVTELTPRGKRRFLLQWTDPGFFSYRAEPVLPGVLSIDTLRSAMDAQYPRP